MLTCDICGGDRVRKTAENVYVCQDCGCEYSLEQVRRMLQGGGSAAPAASGSDFEIVGGVLKRYRGQALDVTVPDGVVAIGERVFMGLKGLRSVSLPEGLTEIEREAFKDCERLERIHLPEGLKKIFF